MKNQKALIIGGVVILIALVTGIFVFKGKQPKAKEPVKKVTRKVTQINRLPVKERPFVTLTPRADGREVTLIIDNVKGAVEAEYELEYHAKSMIQGVFGTIDFSKDAPPVSKDLLFGSCSKGKCRYDEGVTGGNLSITFQTDNEPYALKTDFNLQLTGDKEGIFTSKDIKAKLDVGTSLPDTTYLVVAQTMGLPGEIEGEVLAGPYAFLAATSPTLKKATLTIQSKKDLSQAKLLFWNDETWEDLDGEMGEGKITAPITSLGTFVLVN